MNETIAHHHIAHHAQAHELLAQLTSDDAVTLWRAACKIQTLWNKDILSIINTQRTHIEQAVEKTGIHNNSYGVVPYAYYVNLALKRLEFVHTQPDACLCAFYPQYMFYNPEAEAEAKRIHINERKLVVEKYTEYFWLYCTSCNQPFKANYAESHYPWWHWKRLDL